MGLLGIVVCCCIMKNNRSCAYAANVNSLSRSWNPFTESSMTRWLIVKIKGNPALFHMVSLLFTTGNQSFLFWLKGFDTERWSMPSCVSPILCDSTWRTWSPKIPYQRPSLCPWTGEGPWYTGDERHMLGEELWWYYLRPPCLAWNPLVPDLSRQIGVVLTWSLKSLLVD